MGDYRSLRVWRAAHELTLAVYSATTRLPAVELYGLTSQLRRSAASIPANLAEGCGRDSDAELARFSRIALGSANELDYHLLLARDLGFLPAEPYQQIQDRVVRVKKMLARLIESVAGNGVQPRNMRKIEQLTDSRQPTADSHDAL